MAAQGDERMWHGRATLVTVPSFLPPTQFLFPLAMFAAAIGGKQCGSGLSLKRIQVRCRQGMIAPDPGNRKERNAVCSASFLAAILPAG
jgi:hypothetical protein